MIADDILT